MLSVVEPFASGLGGGAFWLIYDAKTKQYKMLDARETAPLQSHKNMYLDENEDIVKKYFYAWAIVCRNTRYPCGIRLRQ